MEEPPSFLIFSPLLTEQGLKAALREGDICKEILDSPWVLTVPATARMSEKKLRHSDVSYFPRPQAGK